MVPCSSVWWLCPSQPSLLHSHLGTCWCRKGCSAQSNTSEQVNTSHSSQRLSESCLLLGNGGGMKVFGIKEWWPGIQPPMAHFKYYFEPSSAGPESHSLSRWWLVPTCLSLAIRQHVHRKACSEMLAVEKKESQSLQKEQTAERTAWSCAPWSEQCCLYN